MLKIKKILCLLLLTSTVHANTVYQKCEGGYITAALQDQTIIVGSTAIPHFTYEYRADYMYGASNTILLEQWYENSGSTTYYIKDVFTIPSPTHIIRNKDEYMNPVTINTPGVYRNKIHLKSTNRNCDITVESITTVVN